MPFSYGQPMILSTVAADLTWRSLRKAAMNEQFRSITEIA